MKLNKFIFLVVIIILTVIGIQSSTVVFSAKGSLSEDEISKQYGFTFPIGELGNCATIAECGNYCKIDGNLPSCMAFVKKYQITKDDVLTFTISELGNCQMGSDCRNFCNRDENITQCIDFADKYDLLLPPILNWRRNLIKQSVPEEVRGVVEPLSSVNATVMIVRIPMNVLIM